MTNRVQAFYDTHPINEPEILAKVRAAGKDVDALRPEDATLFDQDHYGGTEATDALAERLGLRPGERVLDMCAGMGGTSRYLAWRHGCDVTGVEFNAGRVAGANALTRRVGLAGRVRIVQGDATRLALVPAEFDAAVSQEAFLHIADKPALLESCRRMLRAGGRLGFTDLIATARLTPTDREALRAGIAAESLITPEEYLDHLATVGFRAAQWEDLSPWWAQILRGRLEMYRSLEDETVRRFGREHHERYIAHYSQFVATVESGRLGGGRFWAVKGSDS
jgi:cyclopropane fatty-acyl-phospholipid synthase-like methyltransferase